MNCGQQFGQHMAFENGFLLQAILACNSPCVDLQHYNSTPQTKNIRRKIFRFYGGYGADGGSRTHATVSCPKAFRVFWYISQLTVFVGKKRKLSEDDSTDLRRKMLKKKSFLTSERRNSNPFRNAEFSGKKREKQAFLARWRDVGEKNRREQKSSIFLIVMGIYRSALTKFYANSPLPQKSNRPCLLLMSSNNGR